MNDVVEKCLEQLPGLIMIDMEGVVFYVNQQCADYFRKEKKAICGRHIKEVFPETKMLENLDIEEPVMVFYNSFLGIGISMNVPLYDNGRKVGLMEYDVAQHSEMLYELSSEYSSFLDQELKNLTSELNDLVSTKYTINNLIGESACMQELKRKIITTARSSSTVLITGETGTGKELVAHAIHNLSSRRKNRFIKINAAAFPESLVESEFFGYEGGAFTGASKEGRKGKFELADKGTLFIDEINQMPLSMQPKLLRVLQEMEFERLGSEETVSVDVRVIVATNENLEQLVKQGRFRRDLYYRLNVIDIRIPPLRERPEDIELITEAFIEELNAQLGLSISGIDPEALSKLECRRWYGNVRELRNAVERAMNFSSDNILYQEDFGITKKPAGGSIGEWQPENGKRIIDQARDSAEKEIIINVLEHFDGNKSRAAEYLGIARPVLYQKMKRLGIKQEF